MMMLMFLSATYWTWGSVLSRVTRGAASFFTMGPLKSSSDTKRKNLRMTLRAESTTAQFACWSLGMILSITLSASLESLGL